MSTATPLTPPCIGPAAAALSGVLIDGHAHFYPTFGLGRFLSAAAGNLAQMVGPAEPRPALALVLAERRGSPCFGAILRAAAHEHIAGWTVERTREPNSLIARHPAHESLFLVGARQIVTAEGVEVLAVPMARPAQDRRPLRPTLESIIADDATPVLPWGIGKWWGVRGRIVADVLRSELGTHLYVGDVSSRPRFSLCPSGFRSAANNGIPLLPGSDPLPISAHAALAGSYGACLHGEFDPNRPAASVRRLLRARALSLPRGRRSGWLGVLRSQATLRMRPGQERPEPRT